MDPRGTARLQDGPGPYGGTVPGVSAGLARASVWAKGLVSEAFQVTVEWTDRHFPRSSPPGGLASRPHRVLGTSGPSVTHTLGGTQLPGPGGPPDATQEAVPSPGRPHCSQPQPGQASLSMSLPRMTRLDLRNYLERIYNVPVGAVRTRVQHGGYLGHGAPPGCRPTASLQAASWHRRNPWHGVGVTEGQSLPGWPHVAPNLGHQLEAPSAGCLLRPVTRSPSPLQPASALPCAGHGGGSSRGLGAFGREQPPLRRDARSPADA